MLRGCHKLPSISAKVYRSSTALWKQAASDSNHIGSHETVLESDCCAAVDDPLLLAC